MEDLTDLVIEALNDSDFDAVQHEAYGYVCDMMVGDMPPGRLRDWVFTHLDALDWNKIDGEMYGMKICG